LRDGAVYLTQRPFSQGGLLLTDRKYGDFEFYMETDITPGYDSGLFLRSTEEGSADQIELDAAPRSRPPVDAVAVTDVLKGGGFGSHSKNHTPSVRAGGPGDPFATSFWIVRAAP